MDVEEGRGREKGTSDERKKERKTDHVKRERRKRR